MYSLCICILYELKDFGIFYSIQMAKRNNKVFAILSRATNPPLFKEESSTKASSPHDIVLLQKPHDGLTSLHSLIFPNLLSE